MNTKTLLLLASLLASAAASAQHIPERAIVVAGDTTNENHRQNISVMYSRHNLAFEDPAAPRFLFLDKKGLVAFGIGGYVKASAMYDFDGAIDNNNFYTSYIAVPNSPSQRERLGATAAHSTIFFKLVSRQTSLGRVIMYIQSNFAGANNNYAFTLDQAYVSIGNMTFGKARSVFSDARSMAPTIDDQGPSGQVTAKNLLVKYESPSYHGFSGAVSVEMSAAAYTEAPKTQSIAQRFPDIPLYLQYSWNGGDSHVRASAILRELSYRNDELMKNRFTTGWGVQFSTISKVAGGLTVFGHYTYGKGIARYINDLNDAGYDLIPDTNGTLRAPGMAGWTAGLQYDFTSKFFMSASYSQARLYDNESLGADCYDYGQYFVANAFYNPISDLRIGFEYLHGSRTNVNKESGHANRIKAMVQFSF